MSNTPVEVKSDGYVMQVRARDYNYANRREYNAKTRVYGVLSDDGLVGEMIAEEPYTGVSIPFKPESGVDKMRASVWRAWRNATTAEAADRLLPLLYGLDAQKGICVPASALSKVRFSQNAGCSCGCSPGMILDGVVKMNNAPVDIWVSKEAA